MMAVGITAPVLPKLIIEFQHGDVARAAGYVGLFATLWAAMQFVFAPDHRCRLRPLRAAAR